jgi:hypothetical protein
MQEWTNPVKAALSCLEPRKSKRRRRMFRAGRGKSSGAKKRWKRDERNSIIERMMKPH